MQLVKSLTVKPNYAVSRPVSVTYEVFHASYLLKATFPTIDMHLGSFWILTCFPPFLQVEEIDDNGCIW